MIFVLIHLLGARKICDKIEQLTTLVNQDKKRCEQIKKEIKEIKRKSKIRKLEEQIKIHAENCIAIENKIQNLENHQRKNLKFATNS